MSEGGLWEGVGSGPPQCEGRSQGFSKEVMVFGRGHSLWKSEE